MLPKISLPRKVRKGFVLLVLDWESAGVRVWVFSLRALISRGLALP